MKRLLISIRKTLIGSLIVLCLAVPVFSSDLVPIEDFNEVLNQLIVSNDMLLKVQETNKALTSALEQKELDFSTLTQQKNEEIKELSSKNTALIEENNSLRTDKSEILAQLIISNEMNKEQSEQIDKLILSNKDLSQRLKESNLLLTRDVKFIAGGKVAYMEGKMGFGANFSYLPAKHFSIDAGILYSYPYNFVPSIGLSFLW